MFIIIAKIIIVFIINEKFFKKFVPCKKLILFLQCISKVVQYDKT